MSENVDLAGQGFWDSQWAEVSDVRPIDVSDQGLRNYQRRRYHQLFREVFSVFDAKDKCLLELGCANSLWLPYFAKEFGFRVSGMDYSEHGCRLERQMLSAMKVDGEVIFADFFAPPNECLGKYDVVVSFGVAEHFSDTSGCLQSFAQFLKPGGMIFTLIPNMCGFPGFLAKVTNRPFYDLHMIIDAKMLADAHTRAGFVNVTSDYLMSINLGVLNNFNGIKKGSVRWRIMKLLLLLFHGITAGTWFLERMLGEFRPNKTFSPYVVCTGVKPL